MDAPVFPSDLSTLSVTELQALIDAARAWSQANSGDPTQYDAMVAVLAGYEAVTAELASRTPETETEPVAPASATPTMSELAARMAAPPDVAAVVTATEPPASGGTAATPGAGGFSQADLVVAVTAGVLAAMPAAPIVDAAGIIQASAEELRLPDLNALSPGLIRPSGTTAGPEPIRPEHTITAAADIPGLQMGAPVTTLLDLGMGLIDKSDNFRGRIRDADSGEFVTVGRIHANFPETRTLHRGDLPGNMAKIGGEQEALMASGGPCVPAMPYYGLMVQAGAERPLLAGLSTWVLDRMGVTVLAPPTIDDFGPQTRTVTDGATNTNTTVTSATAAFLQTRDRGATIAGTGIPAGATILDVVNATTVTISAAATATATGVTLTIVRRGPVGSITSTQDAAALDAAAASNALVTASKYAWHVTCPSPTTYNLEAIYWFLEFGNWTAKAFPEQIPAAVKLALAWYARTAESKLLTKMKAASTAYAHTGTVGSLRAYVAEMIKQVAYFRNRHRLPESVTLRLIMPRLALANFQADVVLGSGYEMEFLTQSRQVVRDALGEINVVMSDYIDSATGDAQLFAPGPAALQGGKLASGGTLTFPSTVASFLFPEGSFLAGVSSSIDFGTWRDSFLNENNNYRMGFEGWETIVPLGYEMLEITSTLVAKGTFAGPAYGSSGLSVAFPTSF